MDRAARHRRGPRDVEGVAASFRSSYSTEEDVHRTNVHYEQPPEFFTTITGGEWNVYSCNIWDGACSETESQLRKLDLLARLMGLRPGQRILDVGCGWAGPLVYLAKRYGIRGVGLTISPTQKRYADRLIREHGVDVEVRECHWRDYEDAEMFDAVYTDEVIVHFSDLSGFFERVKALLKPGGRMLNKELHFASGQYKRVTRGADFVDAIYGGTGNYRTLHEELAILDQAGIILERIEQIPLVNYQKTAESWLGNMRSHRQELEKLVGTDYYHRFRTYLMIARRIFGGDSMTIDVVVGRRPA